jgi:hypothetical protein
MLKRAAVSLYNLPSIYMRGLDTFSLDASCIFIAFAEFTFDTPLFSSFSAMFSQLREVYISNGVHMTLTRYWNKSRNNSQYQ